MLDGTGYADDVHPIAAQWSGHLAFHVYPNWLEDGKRTQENFLNLVLSRLEGISHRTFITEFGANLMLDTNYQDYHEGGSGDDGDVNMLRGLADAVQRLEMDGVGIAGAFYWHGWAEKDSYAFWNNNDASGSKEVKEVLKHVKDRVGSEGSSAARCCIV